MFWSPYGFKKFHASNSKFSEIFSPIFKVLYVNLLIHFLLVKEIMKILTFGLENCGACGDQLK